MDLTYASLLDEYKKLFDNQTVDIKQAIKLGENYINDMDLQTVLGYLSQDEPQYKTYSHS